MTKEQNLEGKVTREEILKEIESTKHKYIRKNGKSKGEDLFWIFYFNNFSVNAIPSSATRLILERSENEHPNRQHINQPGESELRHSQTYTEFVKTIDKVVTEEGISLEELEKLKSQKPFPYAEINKLLFPAYIRLREMGYNHYPDLTV